ncbi:MAG: hypothetical protein ACW98I_19425 [Candidatus Hodarchaeales archaeon]|jgi:hypothetical protein
MPKIPFRKKKKKNLPKPPSLSNSGGSMFDEVLGELRASQGSETRNPPEEASSPKMMPAPPQRPTLPSYDSDYSIPGPPRKEESFHFEKTQELQGPPREPTNRRSPNLPEVSYDRQSPSFGAEQVSDDILEELKMKDFNPNLVKAPPKRFIPKSDDDLKKQHLQESKREYFEAANKQLELNFYDNAATYIACGVLCILISDGLDVARSSLSKLSSSLPSNVLDNVILDNVRLLLDSTKNRNFTFLKRAEKTLNSNLQQLYPEDIAIIESGIKTAKSLLGL